MSRLNAALWAAHKLLMLPIYHLPHIYLLLIKPTSCFRSSCWSCSANSWSISDVCPCCWVLLTSASYSSCRDDGQIYRSGFLWGLKVKTEPCEHHINFLWVCWLQCSVHYLPKFHALATLFHVQAIQAWCIILMYAICSINISNTIFILLSEIIRYMHKVLFLFESLTLEAKRACYVYQVLDFRVS